MIFTHPLRRLRHTGRPDLSHLPVRARQPCRPDAPDGVVVAAAFSGRVRDVLLGFKYRNRRAVAGHLAGLLVNRLVAAGRAVDVVTWAPTSRRRRRERGFDQAELVARHVARQLGVPCRRLLERADVDGPQTGRARDARLQAPLFRAHPNVPPARVLLVDDVVTTGATLRAAAAQLEQAGATRSSRRRSRPRRIAASSWLAA